MGRLQALDLFLTHIPIRPTTDRQTTTISLRVSFPSNSESRSQSENDDLDRTGCRQMAGFKIAPQSAMIQHQKPLSVVVSESLLFEGP